MRQPPAPFFFPHITLCVALFFIGCAPQNTPMPRVALYEPKVLKVEYGKASFYGGRWIGRLTANGEHYHSGDCTAAHKKLPFNTMVRVTNLKNGKSVIVRVNNRGPYAKGRILDLSIVAARKIEMMDDGIVPVRAEVLKPIEIISQPNRSFPGMEQKKIPRKKLRQDRP
jgi:rare lipoprotein A